MHIYHYLGFPDGASGKEPACQCGRLKIIPGFDPWVGKIPWRGHSNPLQYSCLENPMFRGPWQATDHRVTRVRHDWNDFLLLLFGFSFMFNSLRPHGLQHSRLSCLSPSPGACSNSGPSSWWCHPTISEGQPLLCPSPPAFSLSQHQSLFQGVSSLHQVARVLEFQLQHQSFQWISIQPLVG